MATVEGSPPSPSSSSSPSLMEKPLPPSEYYSLEKALKSLEQVNPWIEQAMQRAVEYRHTLQHDFESAIAAAQSRLSHIRSTSSAHFQQTLGYAEDLKAVYATYEEKFFADVKEGALIAASHPFITTGAALGLSFLVFKGPRSYLYYRTLRLLSSEEYVGWCIACLCSIFTLTCKKTGIRYLIISASVWMQAMLSQADSKVKELRQSFESFKAEAERLEILIATYMNVNPQKHASSAEEEMKRARTKMRDAGVLIREAVLSTHKIEKQATGLKDIIADLPRMEASKFRSQISNIVSEAKRERKVLSKEVTKISNYGISMNSNTLHDFFELGNNSDVGNLIGVCGSGLKLRILICLFYSIFFGQMHIL
ncbi:hypothetical protein Cgig2_013081 [Carnegiea gigantea]|uniref:Uncharacterized protein n=1 Tax=Carnegiea gigantea TaxID=171969 RepID=A0A9Q1KPG6_9CARY|nr:hypothetical protein Cgig2_013081 [Carnegiea gigantea]